MINLIQEFCDNRGITPYALARDTGVSLSTVYRLTKDKQQLPSIQTVAQICDHFQVQPTEIILFTNKIPVGEEKPVIASEGLTDTQLMNKMAVGTVAVKMAKDGRATATASRVLEKYQWDAEQSLWFEK